jgi:FkbM family methyltransferase
MRATLRFLLMPFRMGAVSFRRGNFVRSLSIGVLKIFASTPNLVADLKAVRPVDRPDLSFEPSDSMVIRAVYWFGVQGYEGILASTWVDLCSKAENILEVGGNVGFYTVLGAKATKGRYCVVEQVPEIANTLQANLVRNGLQLPEVLVAAVIPGVQRQNVELNIPNEGSANPVGSHLVLDGEVFGRSSQRVLTVAGLPFVDLIRDKDLIKIDAEGIEYALLSFVKDELLASRPTLVIEILPEAENLGALISDLAKTCRYIIHVVPAYGSDQILTIPASEFNSKTPGKYNSKDVILAVQKLSGSTPVH